MNRLYLSNNEGAVLALILEPGNLQKLVEERKPIEVKLHEGPWKGGIPPKVTLNIFYSETPIADAKEIRKLLPDAVKMEDQRLPVTLTKKPHCAECKSVIEQLMVWKQKGSPWVVCCAACGAAFGVMAPMENIEGEVVKAP